MNGKQYAKEFKQGYNRTTRLLLSKGVPKEEASDVAQEAWVKGWGCRDQLHDRSKTAVWVNSIAVNCYRNRYRKKLWQQELEDRLVAPNVNLAAIDVYRMLKKCSEAEQEILRRRYLESEPIREIAQDLNCSETAVRLRLMRARRSLREAFEN